MGEKVLIKSICESPFMVDKHSEMRRQVNCMEIDHDLIMSHFSSSVYFDAFIAILVLSGNGSIYINYKRYEVRCDMMSLLSSSHLFHFGNCSSDFRCLCLFVSRRFMEEMDSTDMINKRVRYGVRLYNSPVIRLPHHSSEILRKRYSAVNEVLDMTTHFYYREVVLNRLFAFYLDLSDIIERCVVSRFDGNLTRYEGIIQSFIELLAVYYRKEHHVEFYASRLNLSAHYLTLIVKRVTGQSICDFIFEMLFSEARTLLAYSKLSIQEIASVLNFSDQSSFGKFFKRRSGMSPIEFRKR